ncbi:uncharacterized protein TRIADDRAFT_55138 [Trichoplax adhaerens]|uniref:G-protein coupled receptors family 1 profile domain-containing protein n=1 Tax=Trichoplax adhaerens TaxID=10228 RepID=B3RU32_TRIAD|nr:hypothetical protein TRIADDRAFT_55138 [Trichoplax adhaerens]EDV25732.1 hypothetical protein TRIADDRAFT_55138 [Trichoplax adhaerens]|eukprot:XP_002111765.1 hypothetical protein TRIADDRAFT_55138 [Trichoplax adhaerens]
MAVSDLLCGICQILFTIAQALCLSQAASISTLATVCKLVIFPLMLSLVTTTQSLSVICIDRYYVIISNRVSTLINERWKLMSVIVFTWLSGLMCSAPFILFADVSANFSYICDLDLKYYRSFTVTIVIVTLISYVIPLFLMVSLYGRIIFKIRATYNRQARLDQEYHSTVLFDDRRYAAVRVLIIATAVFMLASWPYFVVLLSMGITGKNFTALYLETNFPTFTVILMTILVTCLTSLYNPMLYGIQNPRFRQAMWANLRIAFYCRRNRNINRPGRAVSAPVNNPSRPRRHVEAWVEPRR